MTRTTLSSIFFSLALIACSGIAASAQPPAAGAAAGSSNDDDTQPTTGITVGGQGGSRVGFDFDDPRSNDAAAAARSVGGVSVDFGNLNIDPSDLGGTNGLPPEFADFEANPGALDDALADPALQDLMNGISGNTFGDPGFEDWVSGLIDGQGNPWDVTDMDPSVPTTCTTETETRESVNRTTYSCSVDDGREIEQPVCTEILVHPTDDDYVYTCEEDRPTTNDDWSGSCEPLEDDPGCEQTDESCLEEQEAIPATYSCEDGRTADVTDEVCVERRRYELDADYEYECTRRWEDGRWVLSPECEALEFADGCERTDTTCIEDGPPVFEDLICYEGPGATVSAEECRAQLNITVERDYMYECRQRYDVRENRWEFVNQELCEELVFGCEQVEGWTCDAPGEANLEDRICEIGEALSSEEETCVQDRLHTVDLDFRYDCEEVFNEDTGLWESDPVCTALDAAEGCSRDEEFCELPREPVFVEEQCRTGVSLGSESRSCRLPLEHAIDVDYVYGCQRTWNPATQRFEDSAGCSTLRSQCDFLVENCTTPAPSRYEDYSCRYGERAVVENETLERRLAITVDVDYIFAGYSDFSTGTNTWVDDRAKDILDDFAGCRETATSCVTESPGVYSTHTCERGYRIETNQQTCRAPRDIEVDVDYSYEATRDWNGSSFVPSWEHNRLRQYNCVQESTRCTEGSPGVYSYHQCRIGWRNNDEQETCSRPLVVTVDADYQYRADSNWNGSRWVDTSALNTLQATGGCTQASRRCTQESPGVFETYTCRVGTELTTTNNNCWEHRQVTVTRRWRHQSLGYRERWDEPGVPSNISGPYISAGCTADGGPSCTGSGGFRLCKQNYICTQATVSGRTGTEIEPATSDSINSSSCNQYNACTQVARVCVQGAETRTINGAQVYRDCWAWRRTYACETETPVNTCSPPGNAQHVRNRCLRYDGGSCGLTEREYRVPQPDPSGGCHRYEHTFWCENQVSGLSHTSVRREVTGSSWDNSACTTSALGGGSCSLSSTRCVEGAGTRTINGLQVYRDCWRQERTYTCERRENINTCNPPSGSSLQDQECVWSDGGGTCRLWDRTYAREEADPSGGCHEFTDRFRCEDRVGLVGPVVQEHRDIVSDGYDRSACASYANDSNCTRTARRCVDGSGTRTINGLSVTRSCWEEEDVYSCDVQETVDTCNPPAGATRESRTCLWSDNSGTCRLYREEWVREEADPSGGCHRYQHNFLCEDYVGGIGTPIDTRRDIASETLTNSAEASQLEEAQCELTNTVCTEGRATRTLNGLQVTRDCWAWDYSYQCTTYESFDGCQAVPAGCEYQEEVCAETYPDGSCASTEKRYVCEVDDGSGGCHVFTGEYRCENQTSGVGPVLREIRTAGEGGFNESACTAHMGDVGCTLSSTRCVDTTPTTRTVDGVSITAPCWEQERTYTCETQTPLDTCTGFSACDLVATVCEAHGADGSCATTLNTYSCQVDDGSGGCNARGVTFQCENLVAAAGDPTSMWVAAQSPWGWNESCIAHRPEGSCIAVSESCIGSGSVRINPVITAAELAADPALAALLGLEGVTEGSGHANEILGAGGVWRISADNLSLPSVPSDCIQREVTYDCEVAEAVNTCGEFEARTSGGSSHAELAAPQIQYAALGSTRIHGDTAWFTSDGTVSLAGLRGRVGAKMQVSQEDTICHPDIVYGDGTDCRPDHRADQNVCDLYPQICDPDYDPDTPGEGELGDCSLEEETCVASNRAGDCVRWQRRYECAVGDDSQGCTERSDLWRCEGELGAGAPTQIVYRPGQRSWNWVGCEELDNAPRCEKTGAPYCTDSEPREREIAPGVFATADCWELTQDYTCDAVVEPFGCTSTEGCTFVASQCLERDFDGSCLRERHEYLCPGEDQSGGCAVNEDTYWCEDEVPGAGDPSDMGATIVDEEWVADDCPPAGNDQCVEEPEPVCVDNWADGRPVTDFDWRGTVRDPWISQFEPERDVFVNGCQMRERRFQCVEYRDVSTCEIPDTCQQVASACLERDPITNACIRNRLDFECQAQPAGCVRREREYMCEDLVDGAGPPDDTVTEVGEGEWQEADCPDVSDEDLDCEPQETVCTEGAGSRLIGGQEVFEECWARETAYICEGVGEILTDCDPPDYCEFSHETCLDEVPSENCRSVERVYQCEEVTESEITQEVCEREISCLNGNCIEVEHEPSTNMPEALARLAGLSQAHDSVPDGSSLDLMSGDDLRCHKTGIWKNCCSNGGDGIAIDWLGGSCNEQEQELAHRTAEGLCVEVGWYCAKRGWFGCRKRMRTSCCFGSQLARIINEQGREQLGMGWGDPRNPQCGGLSPEQFSQLDLSNVDFSEVLGDVTDSFSPDGEGDVVTRIQDRLGQFYSTGEPTNMSGGGDGQ